MMSFGSSIRKTGIVALLALAFLPQHARISSGDDLIRLRPKEITDQTIGAIDRGLEWLAKEQNPNGSMNCVIGYKLNEGYVTDLTVSPEHIAVTALACMAFMANGSTPDGGKYSKNISKALEYIMTCVRPDGYITKNGTRMYEHAFTTLCLAQAAGMSTNPELLEKLKLACNLLIRCQNPDGGWRYQPQPVDADISVTVSTLQALRAARNVGVYIPKEVIDNAMTYIKQCYNAKGKGLVGSFRYQKEEYSRTSFALTACGVVSLYSAGEYDSKEVKQGLIYLGRNSNELNWGSYHYFYGHYYASQAFYASGDENWQTYFSGTNGMRDELINSQNTDGYWQDDVGPTYATAMACLILQVPFEYLPIFQK